MYSSVGPFPLCVTALAGFKKETIAPGRPRPRSGCVRAADAMLRVLEGSARSADD